jgi:hypothetical protein
VLAAATHLLFVSAACCCSPQAAVTYLQICPPSCDTMRPVQQTSTSLSSRAAWSMGATAETCSALRSAGSGMQTSSAGLLLCLACRAPVGVFERPVQMYTPPLSWVAVGSYECKQQHAAIGSSSLYKKSCSWLSQGCGAQGCCA